MVQILTNVFFRYQFVGSLVQHFPRLILAACGVTPLYASESIPLVVKETDQTDSYIPSDKLALGISFLARGIELLPEGINTSFFNRSCCPKVHKRE